jgi:hypothetical protein
MSDDLKRDDPAPGYMDDTRIAREIPDIALPPTDPVTGRDDGIVEMAAGRRR